MSAVNQQRLLRIAGCEEAPEWFVKLVQREFMKLEYGDQFAPAAQAIWKELREGFDPEDGPKSEEALLSKPQYGSISSFLLSRHEGGL